jgi:F0F1-type ATP synthase assembly protein I
VIQLLVKALISGVLIATASEVARRSPGWGGLIVALPMTTLLTMIWLWRDTHDPERVAALGTGAFWFVVPTLPAFLLIPFLLRQGMSFWLALLAGCALTVVLYSAMIWAAPRFGLRL